MGKLIIPLENLLTWQWTRTFPEIRQTKKGHINLRESVALLWMRQKLTSTGDGTINEFGCNIEISWNVCAGVIGQWKAHVSNLRNIAIVCMTCIDLSEPWSFCRIQNVCYAHLSLCGEKTKDFYHFFSCHFDCLL